MKKILIAITLSFVFFGCNEKDSQGLYNYTKAKYNEAVETGIAYKDSIDNDNKSWVLVERISGDICVYENVNHPNKYAHYKEESYYRCSDSLNVSNNHRVTYKQK